MRQVLRLEIQYQRVTQRKDAVARNELYKVNKLTVEVMKDNLITLVEDLDETAEAVIFPNKDDIMEKLVDSNEEEAVSSSSQRKDACYTLLPSDMLAVIWDEGELKWYLGLYS